MRREGGPEFLLSPSGQILDALPSTNVSVRRLELAVTIDFRSPDRQNRVV